MPDSTEEYQVVKLQFYNPTQADYDFIKSLALAGLSVSVQIQQGTPPPPPGGGHPGGS